MSTHVIRLRGPWEVQALDLASAPQRIAFPCRWKDLTGAASSQKLLLRRKFHAPTNLSVTDQIWLCLDGTANEVSVFLNHQPLSPCADGRSWEMTQRMLPGNTLELHVAAGAEMEAIAVDARLEIRSLDADS